MMNLGDGESQIVEFWPGLPNHGAFGNPDKRRGGATPGGEDVA